MNNVSSVDHAVRDFIDDTDFMLPRYCTEFPRLSSSHTDRTNSETKPWGKNSDPVYIEPFLDENLLKLSEGNNYEMGRWYYTGYPLTDHHDMAGLPNVWGKI